ncbi:hypothetical protein Rhe02_44930 [Rhizocola hellebori]|uniref:Uncharacterized protein n=1 Tax=Rhizocola hellebori TaxID=1392758 RepID=A0A8J3QBB6_9ACTN|nr:hypothetical protein [Rhizocola hellebori]GIH06426.1 hypothetical protein Rhe02_44930 [Rhizocola hellebori]
MTSANLRDLLDEATRDIPASVAQPPLSAIRDRVKRRRAGFAATGVVAAVALAVAVAIPLQLAKAHRPAPPAATPSAFAWEFGYVDGAELTVYATRLPPCTFLDNPTVVSSHTDGSYTIRLIGDLGTTSGCATSGPGASGPGRLATAKVQLDGTIPLDLIRDAVSRQFRPIYSRAELPVGFTEGLGLIFEWGYQSVDDAYAEFYGRFQTQNSYSPPIELTGVSFWGRGVFADPPPVIGGEPASFGPVSGWLAPQSDGRAWRFLWYEPRGSSWIVYEATPDRGYPTKADLVHVLEKLKWQ